MGLGKNLKEFFWTIFDEKRTQRFADEEARAAGMTALRSELATEQAKPGSKEKYTALSALKQRAVDATAEINAALTQGEDKAFAFGPLVWLGAPLMFATVIGLAMSSLPVALAGMAGMGLFGAGMGGRESIEMLAGKGLKTIEGYSHILSQISTTQNTLEKAGLKPEEKMSPVPLRAGAVMPDGTIYAGTDPKTGGRLYMMPEDAGVKNLFNNTLLKVEFSAAAYAPRAYNASYAHGHNDWVLPTSEQMQAATESLKGTGKMPWSDYWTSTVLSESNAIMGFTHEKYSTSNQNKGSTAHVRLMRVEAPKAA